MNQISYSRGMNSQINIHLKLEDFHCSVAFNDDGFPCEKAK